MPSDSPEQPRSVHTDALATLGTLIGPNERRDAIHLAVEPVEAADVLDPGQHVCIENGKAYLADLDAQGRVMHQRSAHRAATARRAMGIVDPFLDQTVFPGERFWFIMYPRQVRSLRHVWTHPDFPDEPIGQAQVQRDREASERWLMHWCRNHDCPDYTTVMRALRGERMHDSDYGNVYTIDDEYFHFNGIDAHAEIPPEFWDHAECVLGRSIPYRPSTFSCSC